jgi:beta-lactam-binding protein with PASTA domain
VKAILLACALAGCAGLVKTTPTSVYEPERTSAPAPGGDVVVPDLSGKTPEEAAALVEAAGFTGAVESSRPVECYDAPEVEGRINCQQPHAGETVKNYVTVQINVYRKQRIAGAVVRDQLLALIGKTPDEARAALAGYGHDGHVWVDMQDEYDADCGADRVCRFSAPESGMGIHDAITLFINPPPP